MVRNTIRVSYSLDSDQAGQNVRPDLGQNCYSGTLSIFIQKKFQESNSLDLDHIPHFVSPYLEPNSLQNLSTDDTKRLRVLTCANKQEKLAFIKFNKHTYFCFFFHGRNCCPRVNYRPHKSYRILGYVIYIWERFYTNIIWVESQFRWKKIWTVLNGMSAWVAPVKFFVMKLI